MTGLRVLSYNVHRWEDDREALARVVRACAPDVALIQEAPTWWGTRRKRTAMAAGFGMRYVAASARNALLVADDTELSAGRQRRIRRPFVRRRLRLAATQLPGGVAGGVVEGVVTASGDRVALVVCHLGLHIRGRLRELEQVLAACASFGTPYLLAGDLNEDPGGPVWRRLAEAGLTDLGVDTGPTFPAHDPRRRIDVVMASSGLTARVLPLHSVPGLSRQDLAAASDHLPLLVTLPTQLAR